MKGKTVSCSATTFLNFCVFLNEHLFLTLFVQKACIIIKDHLKFNTSNIFTNESILFTSTFKQIQVQKPFRHISVYP
jgi:hypothetical protein